jgi:acyl-CoA reductase-like NAD-dependent aldehyde dehydrogenase
MFSFQWQLARRDQEANAGAGPILPVMKWSNGDELISRVNDTNTCLGGAVWCSDPVKAESLAK